MNNNNNNNNKNNKNNNNNHPLTLDLRPRAALDESLADLHKGQAGGKILLERKKMKFLQEK
mgnify:CR=1 FL=1